MDKKSRIIIFVLIILLLGAVIFALMTVSSKELLRREFESTRERLQQENEALAKKAAEAIEEKKNTQARLEEIRQQLDNLSREKQELERKYDTVVKEREALIERLKNVGTTQQLPPAPVVPPKPEVEDAYWAKVLKEKADLEMGLDGLKSQVSNLKMQVEELKNNKTSLELELKNLNQEKEELERKLSYNEKLIDSISLELVREKKEKRKLEEEIKALKNEYRMAIRRINTLNEEKLNLDKKLQQVQNEKTELERKLKEANIVLEKKILESEEAKENYSSSEKPLKPAEESAQSVELPTIVVRSQETGAEIPQEKVVASKGKVLAVNKEHNFIVIDLGEEQGIKIGDTFSVYRDEQKIANVEVIQTRKNVSACDIRQQSTNIRVGDTVK
jgi:chromosome segregation ATPase